jgi:hypothetical protein
VDMPDAVVSRKRRFEARDSEALKRPLQAFRYVGIDMSAPGLPAVTR